jgi:hypothetical protein
LLAYSSHDDAIDALNGLSPQPLAASYVFADPPAAKYLTQFVKSRASFVNHIPARLLGQLLKSFKVMLVYESADSFSVGPSAPVEFPVFSVSRYRREMLEIPAPQVTKPSQSDTNASFLGDKMFEVLYQTSIQPLKPMSQPKEGDKNFFAIALLTSYVFVVSPIIFSSIAGLGYFGIKLYGRWR